MRKLVLLFSFSLFLVGNMMAQLEPVNWTYEAQKVSDTEYDVVFTADVSEGWFIYSQHLGEDGPIPTAFEFDKSGLELVGKAAENGNKKAGYDALFDMDVIKFSGKTTFTQRIKVSTTTKKATGYLTFMCCNNDSCLPPKDVDFSIDLK